MDTTKTTTHIGLCAGYGGIELGLKRVIPNLRSVALCEIEAFACANLVAKMEAGLMEPVPIWTDLKTFPWEEFRDRVDILTGGYPCQPFSAAGKRLGTEDPRHLWPYIAGGIRILRPKLCFFENVEGHISLGLREVIGELEQIGYTASWGIFSAREVGAPHQRKRVFILAYRKCAGLEGLHKWDTSSDQTELVGADFGSSCQRSAWPSRPGEPQHAWEPPRVVGSVPAKLANFCSRDAQSGGDTAQASGESVGSWGQSEDAMFDCGSSIRGGDQGDESTTRVVGNSKYNGLSSKPLLRSHEETGNQWATQEPKQAGESTRADRPADVPSIQGCSSGSEPMGNAAEPRCQGSRRANDPRGSTHRLAEPVGGCANGPVESGERQTQSPLGRDADGPARGMDYAELQVSCDNRTDELRLLGNGVVPATAERAFRTLLNELNT